MQNLWRVLVGLGVGTAIVAPSYAEDELKQLVDRLLAPPKIEAQAGFTAKVLVPPGQFYDPLFVVARDGGLWLNDDGPEKGEKGSRLLAVDAAGKVSAVADIGKLLPVTGFDIAPKSFGEFEGQIYTLAQAKVKMEGALANHVIQRVDPKKEYEASIVCTLPTAGDVNKGVAGAGVEARFGPEGSPFAGKFFALTAYNNTIYQTTPDDKCAPFVTFAGMPFGLTFAPDGQTMFVTVNRGGIFSPPESSAVMRVSPEGKVDDKPVAEAKLPLGGLGVAPEGFGAYGGQLFVTELGEFEFPVPMTQEMKADGKIHRVTPEGKLELVATGFVNPMGLYFVGKKFGVTDINGDFIG
ncbi:MAG: hypothetical protein ACRERD_24145, partial [Candidatus Binatia bacterium]